MYETPDSNISYFDIFHGSEHSHGNEEVKDAAIVDYDMNHDNKVCTITIDRDVPTSASTEKCTQRAFSRKCSNDDYLWHMVLHIHKNKLPIDIRYSSDNCFDDKANNLRLLTVW